MPLLTQNDSPCCNWTQKSVHNRVQNKCKPNAEIQNLFTSSKFSLRITGFRHEVHEDFIHPIIYNMRCLYRTGNLFDNAIIVKLALIWILLLLHCREASDILQARDRNCRFQIVSERVRRWPTIVIKCMSDSCKSGISCLQFLVS